MLRLAFRCLCLSLAGLLAAPVAVAGADAGRETVVPQENVRFDYAQVLEVNPIYQTLRATRMEQVRDTRQPSGGGLSAVVSAVRTGSPAPPPGKSARLPSDPGWRRWCANIAARSPSMWTTSSGQQIPHPAGGTRQSPIACASRSPGRRWRSPERPRNPACCSAACEHPRLMHAHLATRHADAARMASGMTSRARRPDTSFAG